MYDQAWPLWGVEQRRLAETHFELIDQLTLMINGIDQQVEAVARAVPNEGELPAALSLRA